MFWPCLIFLSEHRPTVTCAIGPRIGSWWIFEGAVMWKENTEIESEGFPSKREIREKWKRHGWLNKKKSYLLNSINSSYVSCSSGIRPWRMFEFSFPTNLSRSKISANFITQTSASTEFDEWFLFKSQKETMRLHQFSKLETKFLWRKQVSFKVAQNSFQHFPRHRF